MPSQPSSMTTLEELGLLKMDFLGLRTLTVIQNAQKLVNRQPGMNLDMDKIDYNDKNVFELDQFRKNRRYIPA